MPVLALAVLVAQTAGAQKAGALPKGPFACTEVIGLLSTGEWFDGRFLQRPPEISRTNGKAVLALWLHLRIRQAGQLCVERR